MKNINSKELEKFLGKISEVLSHFINGARSVDDLSWFNNLPKEVLQKLIDEDYTLKKEPKPFLIGIGKDILPPCSGGREANIYHAKDFFIGGIDSEYEKINFVQPMVKEATYESFQMVANEASFKTLAASLCSDLLLKYQYSELSEIDIEEVKESLKKNNLLFESQEQIIEICKIKKKVFLDLHLINYKLIFFSSELEEKKEKFFANVATFQSGVVNIDRYSFEYSHIWKVFPNNFIYIIKIK